MPTIHREAEISGEQRHRAVEQLSPPEFERFMSRVPAPRASREAPRLSAAGADLLPRMNRWLPEDLRRRYEEPVIRRPAQSSASEAHAEPIRLTDELEGREAARAAAPADLARLRGAPPAAPIADPGLPSPSHLTATAVP